MKTNITIPSDFYKKLYDEIMNWDFIPEDGDDNKCEMDGIEIGDLTVSLCATFNLGYVNDSFDHAFGMEEGHHYNAESIESIYDVQVWYYDEDTDEEICLSDKFDYKFFFDQFKQYGTRKCGIDIRHGDLVVVKHDRHYGAWEKMVYLYTDTRLGVHVCTKDITAKYVSKRHYKEILPMTVGSMSIVGKHDYYIKSRV